jgi:cephalosporin hydroxylase
MDAASDKLESARALAVNDVERIGGVDPHEGLVRALPPIAIRKVVRGRVDVVPAHACDHLFGKAVRVSGRDQLNHMPSRGQPASQVSRMVLHAADAVRRQDARHDADSHAETVDQPRVRHSEDVRSNWSALREKSGRTLREDGLGQLVFKALRYPLKPLLVPRASRAIQAAAAERPGVNAWIELVGRFNYAGITVTSWQIASEIAGLLGILEDEVPQTVLEIGTASGGTLFLLTRVAAPDALLVSVDLRRGPFGGGYPVWRDGLYRSFARERQRVELVRGDSHAEDTRGRIHGLLRGRPVDHLFIDGDHTYEGVARDFADYAPLVRTGGLIAFHDIVPSGPGKHGDPGGVPRFWRELKATHPDATELVEDWEWGSCGIGLVRRSERLESP